HDRAFIDNIVTSTLVFEDGQNVNEYIGGYSDWLRQRPEPQADQPTTTAKRDKPVANASRPPAGPRLPSAERKELRPPPDRIEQIEARIGTSEAQLAAPGFYEQSQEHIRQTTQALAAAEAELETAMARWEELENS